MMKKSTLLGLGIGCYLLFMLLLTPAAVWFKLLPLPAGVQLGAVSGSLLDGRISMVERAPIQLQDVRWQLSLASLWRGEIGVQLDAGQLRAEHLPYVHLQARLRPAGFDLDTAVLRVPLSQVMRNVQLPMQVDAAGTLLLNVKGFAAGSPYCSTLQGTASWQQARFKSPIGWLDLKQINGVLSCEQGNLQLVTSADNPLGLLITAQLQAGQYQLNGTLKPDASMPKEVHDAMRFVGPQDNEGRFPIRLAGNIRG